MSDLPSDQQQQRAKRLFNDAWTFLDLQNRTADDDERMLNAAYASAYFWDLAGEPVRRVRSQWQLARVWTALGLAESAEYHARRSLQICELHDIHGWDRPFAFEALARAANLRGNIGERDRWLAEAKGASRTIEDPEDLAHLLSEVSTIPGWAAVSGANT